MSGSERAGQRPVGRHQGGRPFMLRERRGLLALLALGVAGWLALVFVDAVRERAEVDQRAAIVRATNEALAQRVADTRVEASLVATDAFVLQEARALGYGREGEIPFALRDGASDPAPIIPLGSEGKASGSPTPLEDWMELLFGS